jgi:hypothetical protein
MRHTDVSESTGPSGKVVAILAQFPGPVTLRASKLKWIVVLVGNAFIGVGGVVLSLWSYLQGGLTIGVVAGSVVGLFCVLAATVGTFSLVTERMWAKLDTEGFDTQNVWGRRRHRRWQDTDGFTAQWINFWPCTVYDDVNPASGWWEALNRAYIGGKSLLPDTYGLGAENLAYLMTAWRQSALARRVDSN